MTYYYEETLEVTGPYNFEYALTHYNIYPWFSEGQKLCRILILKPDIILKVEITSEESVFTPKLLLMIKAPVEVSSDIRLHILDKLRWCLLLTEEYEQYYKICQYDPVLMAAERQKNYGRGKLYPDLFEAIVGVILSQNVSFPRIYQMMLNLCTQFGQRVLIDDYAYHAFPTPAVLASKSTDEIKLAKVGYRAKYIKGIAEEVVNARINLEHLRTLSDDDLRNALLLFPGIGLYSANLIMRVGLNRNVHHMDSYVKRIIEVAYFNGKSLSNKQVDRFIKRAKWKDFPHYAIDALTTDSEIWSRRIGLNMNVKSGAKGNAR